METSYFYRISDLNYKGEALLSSQSPHLHGSIVKLSSITKNNDSVMNSITSSLSTQGDEASNLKLERHPSTFHDHDLD